MKNKGFQLLILAIVLMAIALRYFVVWCIYEVQGCPTTILFHSLFDPFIYPVFLFSLVTLPLAIVLFFVRSAVFNSWIRFAMWWLPLSAIFIAITPSDSNSWMPLYFIGKDTVTLVMAGLFTVISLLVIVWKQFDLGKKLT